MVSSFEFDDSKLIIESLIESLISILIVLQSSLIFKKSRVCYVIAFSYSPDKLADVKKLRFNL